MFALKLFAVAAFSASLAECILTHTGNPDRTPLTDTVAVVGQGHTRYSDKPEDELVVLHIGKTGGTTLKHNIHDSVEPHFVTFPRHGRCIQQMADCSNQPHTKYVFLVRAPVHRFVSGWISRYSAKDTSENDWTVPDWTRGEAVAFQRFATPDQLACALSSENARERINAEAAIREIYHLGRDINAYMGGLENLKKCRSQVLWVGRAEHIEDDYGVLIRNLIRHNFLARAVPHTVTRDRVRSDEYSNFTKLSRRAVANLQAWYEKDYEIIEYLAQTGLVNASYPAEVRASDALPPDGQEMAQY